MIGDRLSQMVTYWFVIAWFDNQSVQKSEVRQAAKDVMRQLPRRKIFLAYLSTWWEISKNTM